MTTQRITIHPEWALQRAVLRFVKRTVPNLLLPTQRNFDHNIDVAHGFVFVGWDRGQKRSNSEHIFEEQRGLIAGWPDTGLFGNDIAFLCELKAAGEEPNDRQKYVGRALVAAKVQWAWADSVRGYAAAAIKAGIPLLPNWSVVATHEDELVVADIRGQKAKAEKKRAGIVVKKPRAARPTTSQIRRVQGVFVRATGVGR